ncbi:farnesyl diphosphate synthase [Rhizobium rosettiformans]|uniref:Probable farnesyl diphosphate synthase n=2 Tax=Rhizobium rosettiformans TaxID=1368430 RepID=A0A4S8Q495_9HYPH|nr:farnesyl diphosphate synthase [Rhizobium rosettiformans]MBB5275647.1 farnesyl diphosphate synthase [Rhizobium rosettiformans]THV37392.1 polyprenyl synthetase family protein [Rhizobium rosettiformans W3]
MTKSADAFEKSLSAHAAIVEARLATLLDASIRPAELARPAQLIEAMHYGALNGGKRLRPYLVMQATQLFAGNEEAALQVGCALECLHSYSLVHDDLPAMDDDDLRRGQPTVHKKYDDATAILAGDGLLTYAFDIIASPETPLPDAAKVALVLELSRAAGIGGMAGGQMLDLAAEKQQPDERGIVLLQAMKTGALLRFACEAGAIIAGRPAEDRDRLRRFGEIIGRAFQVADDLLDITSDAATLGKATGKDAAKGKATLVGLKGTDWARSELDRLVSEANALLAPYGAEAEPLKEAAHFIAYRKK